MNLLKFKDIRNIIIQKDKTLMNSYVFLFVLKNIKLNNIMCKVIEVRG